MKTVERCKNCKGQKQLIGMGGMPKKCHYCSGIGYVDKIAEKDVDDYLSAKSPAESLPKNAVVNLRARKYDEKSW